VLKTNDEQNSFHFGKFFAGDHWKNYFKASKLSYKMNSSILLFVQKEKGNVKMEQNFSLGIENVRENHFSKKILI
jgi:hypothetical protein